MVTLRDFVKRTLPQAPKFKASKISFRRAIELLARDMDTEFAGHYIGRVELLAAAILEYDETLASWI